MTPVPGLLIGAPAAIPLLAAAIVLCRAGAREKGGEAGAARHLSRVAATPAAIGLAWVPVASLVFGLRSLSGAPPWTVLAAWAVAGAIALLGGLAGKPRPAGGVALALQLLSAVRWAVALGAG